MLLALFSGIWGKISSNLRCSDSKLCAAWLSVICHNRYGCYSGHYIGAFALPLLTMDYNLCQPNSHIGEPSHFLSWQWAMLILQKPTLTKFPYRSFCTFYPDLGYVRFCKNLCWPNSCIGAFAVSILTMGYINFAKTYVNQIPICQTDLKNTFIWLK
jgi:hypothetical protein